MGHSLALGPPVTFQGPQCNTGAGASASDGGMAAGR